MGNCLALENKVIKIMKMDGKILQYKAPLHVHQVLSEFAGHAISDSLPVHRHLPLHTQMRSGHTYYLLPPPLPSIKAEDNTSKVTNSAVDHGTGVVRIKLMVSKQELKEIIRKGVVTVDQVIYQLQNQSNKDGVDDDANERYRGWKPVLESIPEASDFH